MRTRILLKKYRLTHLLRHGTSANACLEFLSEIFEILDMYFDGITTKDIQLLVDYTLSVFEIMFWIKMSNAISFDTFRGAALL